MSEVALSNLGDAAWLWSWPGGISRATSRRVLAVYRVFRDDTILRDLGMVDVVPAYCSVAVHFDPDVADPESIRERAESLRAAADSGAVEPGRTAPEPDLHRLPVVYDGPDLDRVARLAGMETQAVVELHRASEYTVAMIGFRPHFPYLIGMDRRIATPRLETPRKDVPSGSVGIAGEQTGVYPVRSPGGWNLIGRTKPDLLRRIRPGDTVLFEEV